ARLGPLFNLKAPERAPGLIMFESLQLDPKEKAPNAAVLQSPLTDSNRRPPPYHGGALPTELRGQVGGMSAEQGYVDFRGYRTWHRKAGDAGIPLLALHGGPGSTHNYFAPLERLADERTVVVYDQLGCGRSDRPRGVGWGADLFREEVAVVRGQLGLDRIHLLGTSWGGMLALEHVLSGAEGIASLTLSSTLASIDDWAAEQKRLRDALPGQVVEIMDRHEQAGTYDDPEYEEAMGVYFDRHF